MSPLLRLEPASLGTPVSAWIEYFHSQTKGTYLMHATILRWEIICLMVCLMEFNPSLSPESNYASLFFRFTLDSVKGDTLCTSNKHNFRNRIKFKE